MEEKRPVPPIEPHILGKDDLGAKPESPFDLSINQQLHLERLSRDVKTSPRQDLEDMTMALARQLLIKSNIACALMRRRF